MEQSAQKVKPLMDTIAVGQAAIEYLEAEKEAKSAYEAYCTARNAYLQKVDPARRLRVRNFLSDKGFQFATDHLYEDFVKARQKKRNAKSRLDNRYRRAMAGEFQ